MTLAEKINQRVRSLPLELQSEVLDFVQFLIVKAGGDLNEDPRDAWSDHSLVSAMHGMEDEVSEYTLADVRPELP